jgi:hypothetical protein
VVVTNAWGTTSVSSNAILTVLGPPVITIQPTNQTVSQGTNVTFLVAASGSAPLTYQWRINLTNVLVTTIDTNSPGSNSLTLTNVPGAASGPYTVVITNLYGAVTSLVATLTVHAPPIILSNPTNLLVTIDSNAVFTVVASGSAPLNYRWFFNTTNLVAGATTDTLLLTHVQNSSAGQYHVVVTNDFGQAASSSASLDVVPYDSDNDGIPDEYERQHGLIVGVNDAAADPDGDGMSNLDEYLSGTDPQDKDSVLRVTLLDGGGGGAMINFTAMPNFPYTIQYRTNVESGAWQSLTNLAARPGTNVTQILDSTAGSGGRRFYRIRTP